MQVHTIGLICYAGIGDVLEAVGNFILAVATEAKSESEQRTKLKCSRVVLKAQLCS